jgi:hypothetical protein
MARMTKLVVTTAILFKGSLLKTQFSMEAPFVKGSHCFMYQGGQKRMLVHRMMVQPSFKIHICVSFLKTE